MRESSARMMRAWNRGAMPAVESGDTARVINTGRNSVVGDLAAEAAGGPESGWKKELNSNATTSEKIAYSLGRVLHDVVTDGSRAVNWALNHPVGAMSHVSDSLAVRAGLAPDMVKLRDQAARRGQVTSDDAIQERFAQKLGFGYGEGANPEGIPLNVARYAIPMAATTALIQASGNHDLMNILGGGRAAGYQALMPTEESTLETSNPVLEGIGRYVFGRTGRLLPEDEFGVERPDVSPEDYAAYRRHQFDDGFMGLGLMRATGRNLEGEPEFTMMGFRVPMSAAAASVGAAVGGAFGANIADRAIRQAVKKRGVKAAPKYLHHEGNRRLLGVLMGSTGGAAAGAVGSNVYNDLYVQPLLYPERVAADRLWQQTSTVA